MNTLPAAGGTLHLRGRDGHHWSTGRSGLVLTVADSGSGIPAAVRTRIFDAFYTTKGIGGTGLGLWISREIIDRHHGLLSLRTSQHPGRSGTAFTIFLPTTLDSHHCQCHSVRMRVPQVRRSRPWE